ncbi:GAF and ANTAR domain-containing protein [Streptosporangium amethystogenes]|uniref:GAF and ANTAR domain-containing protein n=1 Tax=Streptosporangium amethystogenes TaxID=2002 RepID=UPI0004C5CC98|nr:GAF and ANTAR domain-containing protein [Streptosporangium amethystogenes]
MDRQRSAAVWAAINDHARAGGAPVSIEAVCLICARTLRAQGVSVALSDRLMGYEPVCASGGAYRLMDLQVTLGEGPGRDALTGDRPVLVGDLAEDGTRRRWPMFAPAAVQAGVRAIFAFPLLLGAISVGVLEISRTEEGWLTPQQAADALVFADAALLVQVRQLASPDAAAGEPKELRWGTAERWAQVHQATGMVAIQSGTDLSAAFVRLRAHAFADERSLLEVARDVVARRLRFGPDRDEAD